MKGYPDAPGHCGVDTSIAAADAIAPRLGRLQRLAETTIRAAGRDGLTTDELAVRLNMERWSRTVELRRKGMIRDSGRRRRTVTGRSAIVLVISTFASASVNRPG